MRQDSIISAGHEWHWEGIFVKFGGKLIHRVVDGHGPIEVIETYGVRSLHFGSSARQSAMDLVAPDHIELGYLRAMLVALLFVPEPKRILLLGLGGGTLARFFLQHFPDAQIEAVELRAAVVDVAQAYFDLDLSPPLEIHVMDAHQYLEDQMCKAGDKFDLILVDVFDAEGPSKVLEEPEFFSRLSDLLAPRGAMAVNLWSGEGAVWREVQMAVQNHFKGVLAALSVLGPGNRICFVLGERSDQLNLKRLGKEARTLDRRFGMEFVRLFERLEIPLRSSGN